MITLHPARHLGFAAVLHKPRASAVPVARPTHPAIAADQVSWGVVRLPRCLDVGDTARRAGIVAHAFPLGDDARALCGFRTPRRRLIDGSRRPLLALPGAHNPACPTCSARVAPATGPVGVEAPGGDGTAWLRARLGIVETPDIDTAAPVTAEDAAPSAPSAPAERPAAIDAIGTWPLRDLLQHSSRHAWQTDIQVWPDSVSDARHRVMESWQGVGRRSMASEGAGAVSSAVVVASARGGHRGQEPRRIAGHRAWMERHRPGGVAR